MIKGMRFAWRIKDNKAGIRLGNQADAPSMSVNPVDERKCLGNFNRNCRMNPRNSEGNDVLEKCQGFFFLILFCFFNVLPDLGIIP